MRLCRGDRRPRLRGRFYRQPYSESNMLYSSCLPKIPPSNLFPTVDVPRTASNTIRLKQIMRANSFLSRDLLRTYD